MPFSAVEYPSLALGLFKSRLRDEGMPCDVVYLNITFAEMLGWSEYTRLIVQSPAMFAAEPECGWTFAWSDPNSRLARSIARFSATSTNSHPP